MVQFELVAPEKLLFSEQVEMVVVPGSEGDFGVLINHAPMIATIRPGVLAVYRNGQVVERIFVTGGFAEVTETTLTVLAEEALFVDSLERVAIERQLALAKKAFQTAETPTTSAKAERQIVVAESMLTALQT
ncbi:ATP synthase epsilon chain [invertebrate metagenome]|uniref:ATP synthase epsilon chain n=1 Tax=invertebrate metagenome TaxID=1711999 RepID=A0A484HAF3_9ZZZZ